MKVLKFGGSSVGTPTAIQGLIQILLEYHRQSIHFAVVFSAFSKVTDGLIEMAQLAGKGDLAYRDKLEAVRKRHFDAMAELLQTPFRLQTEHHIGANFEALSDILQGIYLLREVSPRSLDFVVSFGERNAAYIISSAMEQAGIPSGFLDAREIVRTDAQFGGAKVDFEHTNLLIRQHFAQTKTVQAVTGFIGSTTDGVTTTLGRGGSDYTAAILGAALGASAIEIWTDVDGVLTADPRRVKKAFKLPALSYREAMEMSHFGAKVIYPPTIVPAMEQGIPLLIRNTFNPAFPGTLIAPKAVDTAVRPATSGETAAISGISSINQINLLTLQGGGLFGVPGISARLFGALARAGVNVVIITQGSSESSITFAVSPQQAELAQKAAEQEFAHELRDKLVEPLRIETDLAVVAVVGEGMRYQPGIAGRLFQSLGRNGINIVAIAQGSSEINITVVIRAVDENKALNAIHEEFFLSDTKTLNLFMVGVGLIGGTLLEQIRAQFSFLLEKRKLEIRVVGLANSRKMVFEEEGLPMEHWKTALEDTKQPFSMTDFLGQMRSLNLSNTIFLDNTASREVADFYEQILDSSIAISTPNKYAASGPFEQYQLLQRTAGKRGVQWKYETNVGAGLPIISTLYDLIHSGDRILSIEGVLSGTLSYIFNHFTEGRRFSEVVREAMSSGLTEPDPRDDLSGADVRRKLLILARETGLQMEMEDIKMDNLLPADCLEAVSVAAFFEKLAAHDASFEQRRQEAAGKGHLLRLVAKLEGSRASIGLEAVDVQHPFYFLSGSDNMVVFTTERYRERPLVVRGPGAGAAVTAAGLFAEVIGMVK
ncbi:MAG: bifunctional aspartate kinase/homoserine dehydrogenase I [Lewinellaceae bacterium]|nr:bifunctional aspartate kinase/homoserine dehydrogenase I [Lewinellaceae bacterium]